MELYRTLTEKYCTSQGKNVKVEIVQYNNGTTKEVCVDGKGKNECGECTNKLGWCK